MQTATGHDSGRVATGSRFPCFDGLRAIAALAVFTLHSTGLTFSSGALSAPHWVFNWTSRLGLFGVAAFFVISGFLLYRPFAVAALTDRPGPTWLPFWKRRFFRIFPAYWVALAVAVYVLGEHAFTSAQEAMFHFSLLQTYRGQYRQHGLGIAWTLCIEISFYVALPFIALALRSIRSRAGDARVQLRGQLIGLVAMAAVGLAVRTWWLTGTNLPVTPLGKWFPIDLLIVWLPSYLDWFAFGMAMALGSAWHQRGGRLPAVVELLGRRPWLSWLLAIGCFWVVTQLGLPLFSDSDRFSATQDFLRFLFVGLAAAFFVLPAVFGPQRDGAIRAVLRHPVMVALGLISYGIYLWHFPIWEQVETWRAEQRFPANAAVQIAFVLIATLLVAALSYVIIERPLISWSSGRAAARFRDLRAERSEQLDPPDRRRTAKLASSRMAPERVVVALLIVVIVVAGLLFGSRSLRGGASNMSGRAGQPDTFSLSSSASRVSDQFGRRDQTGLGATDSGQRWLPLSGSWSITRHRASAAPSPSPSFAVVQAPAGTRFDVRATVTGATELAGIAFRCQDAHNCFWVEALPSYGTWSVKKIVAGRIVSLGTIGLARSTPGTSIAVHTDGDRITVSVDGTIHRNIVDRDLRSARGVGLARGAGGTNVSQWTSFASS
jgi:peptidoglycan/LPS O-acetylase OafA/YrhL